MKQNGTTDEHLITCPLKSLNVIKRAFRKRLFYYLLKFIIEIKKSSTIAEKQSNYNLLNQQNVKF